MIETVPVVLTLAELWLLHGFVRHEQPQQEQWKLPPADLDLNEQIAFAIAACEEERLTDYTLQMTAHQLLIIDYWIRDDYKSMAGAKGKKILLATFQARRQLAGDLSLAVDTTKDTTYKQAAIARLNALSEKGTNDANSNDNPGADAGHDATDAPKP